MKHVKQNIHFPIFQHGKMESLESVPTVPPFQLWDTTEHWNTPEQFCSCSHRKQDEHREQREQGKQSVQLFNWLNMLNT